MAVTKKKVQLHKKDDSDEQWLPITIGSCVELTDYSNPDTSVTGVVAQGDSLNAALVKLDNTKASKNDVYTKAEVDEAIGNTVSSVYKAMGTSDLSTTLGVTSLPSGMKVGYVYNLTQNLQVGSGGRTDFLECVLNPSASINVEKGSNVVVVDYTANNVKKYYYDVLAVSSISGGGSGTVGSGTYQRLAYYNNNSNLTQVGSANNIACNGERIAIGSSPSIDANSLIFADGRIRSTNLVIGNNPSSMPTGVTFYMTGDARIGGDLYATGGVTALATSASDNRLKTNVKPFNALSIVDKLKPVSFNWNEKAKELSDSFDSDSTNYGLIAQDSDGVIDNLVFDITEEYKGVRYEKLIPILLQAIKELKQEIAELKSK